MGLVAYKLALPNSSRIHPVFHVSLLKKATGPPPTGPIELPESIQPAPAHLVAILDRKMVKRGNRAATKVLVQWSGLPLTEATWEFLYELRQRFPTLNLGDKVPEGRSH